jgi:hypothetical protein
MQRLFLQQVPLVVEERPRKKPFQIVEPVTFMSASALEEHWKMSKGVCAPQIILTLLLPLSPADPFPIVTTTLLPSPALNQLTAKQHSFPASLAF